MKKELVLIIPTSDKSSKSGIHRIDTIEAQTGLDFFAELDDRTETTLEAKIEPRPWNLQAISSPY